MRGEKSLFVGDNHLLAFILIYITFPIWFYFTIRLGSYALFKSWSKVEPKVNVLHIHK